jgi:hypothetical protein
MQYAIINNEKTLATLEIKREKSKFLFDDKTNNQPINPICPICKSPVIPKCGEINIHHWAHKNNLECDSFWEPETLWHRNWKNLFPKEQTEVTIGKHRADILRKDGIVVELQHSSISIKDIFEREQEYKKMIWLFDGRGLLSEQKEIDFGFKKHKFWTNGNLRLEKEKSTNYYRFHWKHARKHYEKCQKDVFIDLGVCILFLQEMNLGPPCKGVSYILSNQKFKELLLENKSLSDWLAITKSEEIERVEREKEIERMVIAQEAIRERNRVESLRIFEEEIKKNDEYNQIWLFILNKLILVTKYPSEKIFIERLIKRFSNEWSIIPLIPNHECLTILEIYNKYKSILYTKDNKLISLEEDKELTNYISIIKEETTPFNQSIGKQPNFRELLKMYSKGFNFPYLR